MFMVNVGKYTMDPMGMSKWHVKYNVAYVLTQLFGGRAI